MRKLALLCGVCILGLAAGVWAQPGAAGGGGRMGSERPGGGGGGMLALESDWALICFELKVTAQVLDSLRIAYQKAWDQRREVMGQARQGGLDRMVMQERMAPIQTDLEKALQQYLTREQLEQLNQLRSQRRDSWQRGGGGGGGGGRPPQ